MRPALFIYIYFNYESEPKIADNLFLNFDYYKFTFVLKYAYVCVDVWCLCECMSIKSYVRVIKRDVSQKREEEVDSKELNEQEGRISESMRLREREIKNEELSDFKRQQNQRKVFLN